MSTFNKYEPATNKLQILSGPELLQAFRTTSGYCSKLLSANDILLSQIVRGHFRGCKDTLGAFSIVPLYLQHRKTMLDSKLVDRLVHPQKYVTAYRD